MATAVRPDRAERDDVARALRQRVAEEEGELARLAAAVER